MRPDTQADGDQFLLFQAHFDQILNPDHPLVILAQKIDWSRFDVAFADCYCSDMGAPAKAIRLMVGLHYLKHAFNESDESVVERWLENPYWQCFCGYTTMQHELPLHPTSLVKWRKRVGAERLVELLQETIALAVREKQVSARELRQVNVDTTVQEKNITHPTDSKLLYRAIVKLGKAAKQRGISLRQSYVRIAKRASIKAGRYAHAKQFRRMRRQLKFLRTRLGRLIRDIRRKANGADIRLMKLLELCERLQKQQPRDKNKIYSLHEPEVMCISKGKAHKRYEFGVKVSVAVASRGGWFVGAQAMAGNPYDGHTLMKTMEQVKRLGVSQQMAFVDRGYRSHDCEGPVEVHVERARRGKIARGLWRWMKRRAAVEPSIGHLKQERRMNRCRLKGEAGDCFNAIASAAGMNFRKLLRSLKQCPRFMERLCFGQCDWPIQWLFPFQAY